METNTRFMIDIIENGYKIPFVTMPNNVELDNNKSVRDRPDFVTSEIENCWKWGGGRHKTCRQKATRCKSTYSRE